MRLERERVREETAKEKARFGTGYLLCSGTLCHLFYDGRERERRLEAQFAAHQLSLKEKKKKIEMRVE